MISTQRRRELWLFFIVVTPVWASPATGASDISCLVQPEMVVAVGSPVEGLLNSVKVDQGDFVKEGQVLATLESSLEQAEVALAKAKAEMEAEVKGSVVREEFSARKLGRAKDEVARLEATEKKRLAQLELQRANALLGLRTIRSPITGVVSERFMSPGELVKQTPIVKLAQIDPLRVEVFAPLVWLGKISIGKQADVRLEAPMSGTYHARVTVVNPVIDSASGTFAVRLELPNPKYRIPAGLACTVRFPEQ
ncbi:MAG: efflux RND transporter periplasmic adaptor subunit [Deltaproteobacteria bacterium]|nr:MAG: efflux RND transporter periplasmic adaptor subunit [Deltaproteobacteria bacterium]